MSKFCNIIENITSRHVYIQTHNFPDADAIASAFGLSVLLEKYGIISSICYRGQIERYSTNELVNSLGIKMINIEELKDINRNDEVILVDSQKGNSNIITTKGDEIICIDHHPTFENSLDSYRYADVRPELGACSTIIAEYYMDNNIPIDKRVATALIYGICTDTMGLTRGVTDKDVDTYSYLFKIADKQILKSLEHCSISIDDLKAYANAINSIKVCDNVSFANTGSNCPEARIASISDFMLDLIEVDFSVVYSLKKEGIKISVRSMGKYNAGRITNKALSGIGCGGGHEVMAGGFVPLKEGERDIDAVIGDIQERFLRAM